MLSFSARVWAVYALIAPTAVKAIGLLVTYLVLRAMVNRRLGPAPADYLGQVASDIRKLEPDAVIPMHCSGDNFVRMVREQMPDKLVLATIGSRISFGA